LASHTTIVYADLGAEAPQPPSVVAQAIAQAARESLFAGQFEVALQAMTADNVRRSMLELPSGHERVCQDRQLLLLGAGAMLAFAPYRASVMLLGDPFGRTDSMGSELGLDADALRVRLHEAICTAANVTTLSHEAFDAAVRVASRRPTRERLPTRPLNATSEPAAPILVVNHEDRGFFEQVNQVLTETFPQAAFVAFEAANAFERPWKAVVHLGVARSSSVGARLSDAWAGTVPLFQLCSPAAYTVARKRYGSYVSDVVVEHGRTGLRSTTRDELYSALHDFLFDPLPARVVARSARRRIDPAMEWDNFLRAVLA
jgi:hypothetical protein